MAKRRVLIGGMSHETNTFNPLPTTWADFERGMLRGQELIARRRETNTELGGFIQRLASERDIALLPAMYAEATPGGMVTAESLQIVLSDWLDTLQRYPVDGVLLALHGAMVSEDVPDGEGYLLRRLRETVGPRVPIVCTLDLHATLTPELAEHADAVTVYRTYPHLDMAERGQEAAGLLLATLSGRAHPTLAVAKRPLLIGPPHNVLPHDQPMKRIMDRAREMEATIEGVLAACPVHGFMQQDVPHGGVGAAVTVNGDPALAQRLAEELAQSLLDHRHGFFVDLPDARESVALAKVCERPPTAIADSGDNIGGGTPGDGTALLHEILRQNVTSAFVHLVDAEAARTAARAGVGATVHLSVGGKSDPIYGPPVEITGVVRAITDGVYLNRAWGGYSAGVESNMGLTARIDWRGITILASSYRYSPNNIMHAKSVGIYPEDYAMSVCKGGLAFREAYKPPVARTYIQSDTPGYSSSNLEQFTFRRIKRPIYPLDPL
ncbi:MAG: M81 family metallopeptidase [Anaerolineae bacterium]|nr:M81 family metallopeptidase [Anaerolineae bacterium]